jgi:hypothetical protein
MHHELTLDVMDDATVSLGEELRKFNDTTCGAFITLELEREVEARARRAAMKLAASHKSMADAGRQAAPDLQGSVSADMTEQLSPVEPGRLDAPAGAQSDPKAPRLKEFSFKTYKLHALGDYSSTIRRYGTTDSYSTEPVSYPQSPYV